MRTVSTPPACVPCLMSSNQAVNLIKGAHRSSSVSGEVSKEGQAIKPRPMNLPRAVTPPLWRPRALPHKTDSYDVRFPQSAATTFTGHHIWVDIDLP